jgi:hypothetical protein
MLIQIPITQIHQYWQHIRYAALAVNPQWTRDAEIGGYYRNLLINLLSGNYQAFVELNGNEIASMIITRILEDAGKRAHLIMEVIYGFSPVEDRKGDLNDMEKFAKNIGCKSVVCYPGNPMAQNAAKHAGFHKIAEIFVSWIGE